MVPGYVELRYFGCRGRGQALRYALIDAGVAFELGQQGWSGC